MATSAKTTKATGTAVAKAKVNLPANIQDAFAAQVAALKKKVSAPSGDRIIVNPASFKLTDGREVSELQCVVVDFISANFYYDKPFDRNNIIPPVCFAMGPEPKSLVPSANSPVSQCSDCAGCWANQWKSKGDGKACSNRRLLAILPLDADDSTPVQILNVPPTSTSHFDAHALKAADKYGVPVLGVITKITPSPDTYAGCRFEIMEALDMKDPLLAIAVNAQASALERLMVEPDVSGAKAANDNKAAPRAPARRRA